MADEVQMIRAIEKACEFCERTFSHDELIEVLKADDDVQKQICLLNLERLDTQDEAELLVFHLTNQIGVVRECASRKINEFLAKNGETEQNGKYDNLFQTEYVIRSFLLAVNDINPNICRLIIETLPAIEDKAHFLDMLYERFGFVFEELEKLKRSNWYTKKLFNLYWCLEALSVLEAPIDERFEAVIQRCAGFREYTIREKTALVLSRLEATSPAVDEVKDLLKQDTNFYVKRLCEGF